MLKARLNVHWKSLSLTSQGLSNFTLFFRNGTKHNFQSCFSHLSRYVQVVTTVSVSSCLHKLFSENILVLGFPRFLFLSPSISYFFTDPERLLKSKLSFLKARLTNSEIALLYFTRNISFHFNFQERNRAQLSASQTQYRFLPLIQVCAKWLQNVRQHSFAQTLSVKIH